MKLGSLISIGLIMTACSMQDSQSNFNAEKKEPKLDVQKNDNGKYTAQYEFYGKKALELYNAMSKETLVGENPFTGEKSDDKSLSSENMKVQLLCSKKNEACLVVLMEPDFFKNDKEVENDAGVEKLEKNGKLLLLHGSIVHNPTAQKFYDNIALKVNSPIAGHEEKRFTPTRKLDILLQKTSLAGKTKYTVNVVLNNQK